MNSDFERSDWATDISVAEPTILPASPPVETAAKPETPRTPLSNNLKLAVLASCRATESSPPFPPDADYLELTICDVGALRSATSGPPQTPVALPHLRPNHRVRASRTFADYRDNRALADELAVRYEGKVLEGLDPIYSVVAFRVAKADRIFPEYFLKPVDPSLRNPAT